MSAAHRETAPHRSSHVLLPRANSTAGGGDPTVLVAVLDQVDFGFGVFLAQAAVGQIPHPQGGRWPGWALIVVTRKDTTGGSGCGELIRRILRRLHIVG